MGQHMAAPVCACDRRLCGIADEEPMVVVMGDLTMEIDCYPDIGEASCSRERKEASVTSASTADSGAAYREREFLDLSGDGGFEETLVLPETPGPLTWQISIRRESTETPTGLTLQRTHSDRCQVVSVDAGPVQDWNTADPSLAVLPGDYIIEANGKTRADSMLHVITTRKIFDLALRRDRDRASRTPRINGSKADD
mmetsp:Transcript_27669/g.70049  ORF Transcript_27669/g.70049 Transcript_27669/m.70049 type:complete len:197 (-) Transcript_27669:105-695(-)